MNFKTKSLSAILVAMTLSACTSVETAPPHEDLFLKQFNAPQEKAGVYIFRNQLKGHILLMDIAVYNQRLGRTQWETYLFKELKPGKHSITSLASLASLASNVDSIEVDLQPGTLTYIW